MGRIEAGSSRVGGEELVVGRVPLLCPAGGLWWRHKSSSCITHLESFLLTLRYDYSVHTISDIILAGQNFQHALPMALAAKLRVLIQI